MVEVVACVYKTGGDYSLEYVKRLRDGVKKNCNRPFVCLSDDFGAKEYCDEYIPLVNGWDGWWSKIELFNNFDSALYFDLDTVINGDIQELCDYDHKFTMLSDFNKKNTRPASGVMAWNGDYRYIYDRFSMNLTKKYSAKNNLWGDQGYINDVLDKDPDRFQDIFPSRFASYKWDRPIKKRKASVVCYHGKPRPHETGWKV